MSVSSRIVIADIRSWKNKGLWYIRGEYWLLLVNWLFNQVKCGGNIVLFGPFICGSLWAHRTVGTPSRKIEISPSTSQILDRNFWKYERFWTRQLSASVQRYTSTAQRSVMGTILRPLYPVRLETIFKAIVPCTVKKPNTGVYLTNEWWGEQFRWWPQNRLKEPHWPICALITEKTFVSRSSRSIHLSHV